MTNSNRREFFADVGRGMLIAAVGSATALDMGLGSVFAGDASESLTFGSLEPLVGLMEDTPPERILSVATQRLSAGTELRHLVAAAALANARAFGGEDYVGFHTMMAMAPAYHMAQELPGSRQALPVLKVIHRNSRRLQETGGRKAEVLHAMQATHLPEGKANGEALRSAVREKNLQKAEQTFAALAQGSAEDAFNQLLLAVEDATEVHRVVLPYRCWDMLELIGKEYAHALLRQSVHYCVKLETPNYVNAFAESRSILPKMFDQHRLEGKTLGTREADDAWVDHMSQTIFKATPAQAADAAAAALAEGMAPAALAEAISLAANQLVLRDAGRPANQTSPGKPVGSVHGDSIGVHATDSANAWRNLAKASSGRNVAACLILGAYQAALDRRGDFVKWEPYPHAEARERIKTTDPARLLKEAEDAIRNRDQALATAAVAAYGATGRPARPVFDLLLRYAISEDGALHAEKFYLTATEEFRNGRPAFRWRHLIALARVTASEYGYPAPGQKEARLLLKV
ncbi:MAG TPA: hypothetical protein VKI17_06895 [Gemmataceae bacterium]|nr:hypothetical protein [Gemmataceae bacterium]